MSISLPAGRNQTRLAVFSLLVAGLLWGLTWMPLKFFGTQGLNGPLLALASYGPIGLLAVPWLIWRRQAWWQERGLVTLFALTGGAANICFVSALMNGEVVRVMLLFYLAPVWGVLGGRLFLSEPLTKLRITGVLLAVTGALLLLGGPALYATPPGLVDLLALAAGFFYALQNIATRAAHATSLDAKTLFIFVGCGALSAIVVGFNGQSLPPISSTLAIQLLGFSGLWMLAAMLFTAWGVTRLEAGRAAVLLVFELVAAALSAMWIAGERLDGIEWVGAALITGAALLEARSPDG